MTDEMKQTENNNSNDNWSYEDPEQDDLLHSLAGPEDVDKIVEFLLKNFFPSEPLGHSIQLDAEVEVRPWLSKMIAHVVKEKLSIVTRSKLPNDELGEIVAVCVNDVERAVEEPENITIFTYVDPEKHRCMWIITRVLEELVKDQDLFSQYNVDSCVGIQLLSVDPSYGGRGLARKLILLTETLARLNGHSLIYSEATSEFSARAFLKAGFQTQNTVGYDTFTVESEQPFKKLANEKVHTCAKLMIKNLNNE